MRIGELSRRSGVTIETIRFYEAKGLLPPAQRLLNNYRDYGEKHLARLHFIRHCRTLGMTLEDIASLAALDEGDPRKCADAHALIEKKLQEVSERMHELEGLRQTLLELKMRCAGHHENGDCGILHELESYDPQSDACCAHFREPHETKSPGTP